MKLVNLLSYIHRSLIGAFLLNILLPMTGHALDVMTSIKPVQLITLALALPSDTVEYLIPAQASPHTYSPTPSALRKMKDADLLIWIGPAIETRWRKPFTAAVSSLQLMDMASQDDHTEKADHHDHTEKVDHHDHHHHTETDPHIWMSPRLVEQAAARITARLIQLNPAGASVYQSRLVQFRHNLQDAIVSLHKELAPIQGRQFYVMHDAYGYFTTYFNLAMAGYITPSPEVPLSGRHLIAMDAAIARGEIVCVFGEPQLNPQALKKLVGNRPVHYAEVDPLATNIAEDENGYVTFLRALATSFKRCLIR